MSQDAVAEIVKAFLADGNNRDMTKDDLVDLIGSVSLALNPKAQGVRAIAEAEPAKAIHATETSAEKAREPKTPEEIKDSYTKDYIISFIDGSKLKTLKRHLTTNGYTEQTYKAHFGLPHDYPMVAPAYSKARSDMSLKLGLGRKKTEVVAEAPKTEKESSKKEKTPSKPKEVNDPTKEQAVG